MQRFIWSSTDVPVADRLDAFREASLHGFGIRQEIRDNRAGDFQARIEVWAGPGFERAKVRSTGVDITRGRPEIARRPFDAVVVYLEQGRGNPFSIGGAEFQTRPGSLILTDADLPVFASAPDDYQFVYLRLPRSALTPHLPRLNGPLMLHLPPARGTVALLAGLLRGFDAEIDHMSDAAASVTVAAIGALVGMAAGQAPEAQPGAVRLARLAEAKRIIDSRLGDPDLDPAQVAAVLRISVRQLHSLFEPTGISFSRHVQQRRLEAVRVALSDPTKAHRAVSDLAFSCGFNSLSAFYRGFEAAFGMPPGDWRRTQSAHL